MESDKFTAVPRDPVDVALKHISETKWLLERLIVSSEQFDYHQAKNTLSLLDAKVRQLGKFQCQLQQMKPVASQNICRAEFKAR